MRTSVFPLLLPVVVLSGGFRNAKDGEFPFQVTVKDLRKNVSLCSGVLITPQSVVSVASCVKGIGQVKVSAGSSDKHKLNTTITSVEVIVHAKHNGTVNNIAIIKTGDPFPENRYIRTAMVPRKDVRLVERANLSAWNPVALPHVLNFLDNYNVSRDCKRYNVTDVGRDEFCGDFVHGVVEESLVSHNGVVYGLFNGRKGNSALTFLLISEHAEWINQTLGNESSAVKWYGRSKGYAESPSVWVAATLLFAVLLCK